MLSQVADLLGNVQDGIRRNLNVNEPAKANHRLVMTAVGLVGDLVDATRIAGRRLFPSIHGNGTSPLDVYSTVANNMSEHHSDFVHSARSLVREVDRTLKAISVSTTDDVSRSFPLLAGLEHRVRSLQPGIHDQTPTAKLDRLV